MISQPHQPGKVWPLHDCVYCRKLHYTDCQLIDTLNSYDYNSTKNPVGQE